MEKLKWPQAVKWGTKVITYNKYFKSDDEISLRGVKEKVLETMLYCLNCS